MAAVTINANPPVYYNIIGSKRLNSYNITGANGDTLVVGFNTVNKVTADPNAITSVTIAAGSVPGTSLLTFVTGGGAFTASNIDVYGN